MKKTLAKNEEDFLNGLYGLLAKAEEACAAEQAGENDGEGEAAEVGGEDNAGAGDLSILKSRLNYLLEWYSRKAQRNKRRYNLTRVLTYLIPCVITMFSIIVSILNLEWGNWPIVIVAALSTLIVILHHIIDHYRFYENWVRYRCAAEALKRETVLYLNGCKPYNIKNSSRKLFAAEMEHITQSEIGDWVSLENESYSSFMKELEEYLNKSSDGAGQSDPAAPTAAAAK